jgi:guanylate kinase
VDYVFVDRETFRSGIEAGGFLEWAEYSGYYYGTPRRAVLEHLERGENVLLDIENDGAKQVKASYPEAVLIFIKPPSLAELERRLRARGDTSATDIARRLAVAEEQIVEAEERFDVLVVNEDIATVVDQIAPILATTGGPEPASP